MDFRGSFIPKVPDTLVLKLWEFVTSSVTANWILQTKIIKKLNLEMKTVYAKSFAFVGILGTLLCLNI